MLSQHALQVVSHHALQQVSRGVRAIPACIAGGIPACLAAGLQGLDACSGRGVCSGGSAAGGLPGRDPPGTATAAGGTHPTGMHSYHKKNSKVISPAQIPHISFRQYDFF